MRKRRSIFKLRIKLWRRAFFSVAILAVLLGQVAGSLMRPNKAKAYIPPTTIDWNMPDMPNCPKTSGALPIATDKNFQFSITSATSNTDANNNITVHVEFQVPEGFKKYDGGYNSFIIYRKSVDDKRWTPITKLDGAQNTFTKNGNRYHYFDDKSSDLGIKGNYLYKASFEWSTRFGANCTIYSSDSEPVPISKNIAGASVTGGGITDANFAPKGLQGFSNLSEKPVNNKLSWGNPGVLTTTTIYTYVVTDAGKTYELIGYKITKDTKAFKEITEPCQNAVCEEVDTNTDIDKKHSYTLTNVWQDTNKIGTKIYKGSATVTIDPAVMNPGAGTALAPGGDPNASIAAQGADTECIAAVNANNHRVWYNVVGKTADAVTNAFRSMWCAVLRFLAGVLEWEMGWMQKLTGAEGKILHPYINIADNLTEDKADSSMAWVLSGWKFSLALSFAVVGVMLFIAAFANILRLNMEQYGIRRVIPSIIACAFFANASILIMRFFVALANVLAFGMDSIFSQLANGSTMGWGEAITNTLGVGPVHTGSTLQKVASNPVATSFWKESANTTTSMMVLVLSVIFTLAVIIALAIIILQLLFRAAMIYILTILAPLALISNAFPFFQTWSKKWWSLFWTWIFLLPAITFILELASLPGRTNTGGQANLPAAVFALILIYSAVKLPATMGKVEQTAFNKIGGALIKGGYGTANARLYNNTWKKLDIDPTRNPAYASKSRLGQWAMRTQKFIGGGAQGVAKWTNVYAGKEALGERMKLGEIERTKAGRRSKIYEHLAGPEAAFRNWLEYDRQFYASRTSKKQMAETIYRLRNKVTANTGTAPTNTQLLDFANSPPSEATKKFHDEWKLDPEDGHDLFMSIAQYLRLSRSRRTTDKDEALLSRYDIDRLAAGNEDDDEIDRRETAARTRPNINPPPVAPLPGGGEGGLIVLANEYTDLDKIKADSGQNINAGNVVVNAGQGSVSFKSGTVAPPPLEVEVDEPNSKEDMMNTLRNIEGIDLESYQQFEDFLASENNNVNPEEAEKEEGVGLKNILGTVGKIALSTALGGPLIGGAVALMAGSKMPWGTLKKAVRKMDKAHENVNSEVVDKAKGETDTKLAAMQEGLQKIGLQKNSQDLMTDKDLSGFETEIANNIKNLNGSEEEKEDLTTDLLGLKFAELKTAQQNYVNVYSREKALQPPKTELAGLAQEVLQKFDFLKENVETSQKAFQSIGIQLTPAELMEEVKKDPSLKDMESRVNGTIDEAEKSGKPVANKDAVQAQMQLLKKASSGAEESMVKFHQKVTQPAVQVASENVAARLNLKVSPGIDLASQISAEALTDELRSQHNDIQTFMQTTANDEIDSWEDMNIMLNLGKKLKYGLDDKGLKEQFNGNGRIEKKNLVMFKDNLRKKDKQIGAILQHEVNMQGNARQGLNKVYGAIASGTVGRLETASQVLNGAPVSSANVNAPQTRTAAPPIKTTLPPPNRPVEQPFTKVQPPPAVTPAPAANPPATFTPPASPPPESTVPPPSATPIMPNKI